MRKSKLIIAAAAAAVTSLVSLAQAVDYSWVNFAGGTYSWTTPTNWAPNGFPNSNLDTGNISGPVTGGGLNVVLPTNVTVATFSAGATGSPNSVDIGAGNAGGGVLTFDNDVGSLVLGSTGVAGSTLNFSAPVQLGSTVMSAGSTMFTNYRVDGMVQPSFTGGLIGGNDTVGTINVTRQLTLNTGTIVSSSNGTQNFGTLTGGTTIIGPIQLTRPGSTQGGTIIISNTGTTSNGTTTPAAGLTTVTFASGGTVIFNGVISNGGSGTGRLAMGANNVTVPTNYVLNQANTYTGQTTFGKGVFYLNNDMATGTGLWLQNAAANFFQIRLSSQTGARTIANNVQLQQNFAWVGNNSFTHTGFIFQSNNRDFVNLLDGGAQLNFNNWLAGAIGTDGSTEAAQRRLTFDGSGTTNVNGPIYNHRAPFISPANTADFIDDTTAFTGVNKRGTGVVNLTSSITPTVGTDMVAGPNSTYRGNTLAAGGLLQFSNPGAYGVVTTPVVVGGVSITSTGTARVMATPGGAVGVLTGTLTPDFLSRVAAGTLAIFSGGGTVNVSSNGALALAPADAATNINFTTDPNLSSPNANGVSIGALASGVTYTGTITPDPTAGYRLGGGATLTLPNANALTGARRVTVTNGGTVAITGTNNYTGVTTVRGDYIPTAQVVANTDSGTTNFGLNPYAVRVDTALRVSDLANGGQPSSIGSSSSAASNLVLNGGTFSYAGPGDSTDRLFTMNALGTTLDSSGAGSVNFTNTGAIAQVDAAARAATLQTGGNSRTIIMGFSDISDLAPGMTVTATDTGGVGTYLPAGTTIAGLAPTSGTGIGTNQIATSNPNSGTTNNMAATLTFGNQNRTLNLTGSNVAANTLSAQLTNSVAGNLAVAKNGSGQWVLAGTNNTYTGGVTVNSGTLGVTRLVNNGTTAVNGGRLKLAYGLPFGSVNGTSVFQEGQFTLAAGARLDVSKGAAAFEYSTTSPLPTIKSQVISGYNGGNWNGAGITSADAAAQPTKYGVGYAEASQALGAGGGNFAGQTVDGTTVLVRYALLGDTNLDGTVNLGDFANLTANFNQSGQDWFDGDFTYDGNVNLGDFASLTANFNQTASASLPGAVVVPEPTTVGLLAAAGALALGRRHRKVR